MATKYIKKTEDPFLDWLVRADPLKRDLWILNAQLYRIEILLIKNNFKIDESIRELIEATKKVVSSIIVRVFDKKNIECGIYGNRLRNKHGFLVSSYVLEFNELKGRT